MSRVAKQVIDLPTGVTVTVDAGVVTVKGAKGALTLALGAGVSVAQENKQLRSTTRAMARRACAPARRARTWRTWCWASPRATSASSSWSASVFAPRSPARR